MSTALAKQTCIPCSGKMPPATAAEVTAFHQQVPDWKIQQVGGIPQLKRIFRFKNFQQALDFTNAVGQIAEAAGHHPAITTEWGKVTVVWWTHAIRNLHENDFVMAAKTDELAEHAAGLSEARLSDQTTEGHR